MKTVYFAVYGNGGTTDFTAREISARCQPFYQGGIAAFEYRGFSVHIAHNPQGVFQCNGKRLIAVSDGNAQKVDIVGQQCGHNSNCVVRTGVHI